MGTNSSAAVSVGKPRATGAIFSAPLGTALPLDATTKLDQAFKQLGYASEDGLSNEVETDNEDIKAWGGDTVLSVRTARKETFKLTLIQSMDIDTLKEVYGQDNVSEKTGALTVLHNGKDLPHRSYVFEMLLTGGRVKRIVVPDGLVSEVGEVKYADGEPIGYETTITGFPDSKGNTAYEYISAAG